MADEKVKKDLESVEKEIKDEKLQGNSIDPEREPIKKIVSATRIERKKSWRDSVLGEVANYILFEVLIPAAKDTLSDILHNGSDMMIYGEAKGNRRRDRDRDRGRTIVSYSGYYDRDRDRDRGERRREPARDSRFHLDDILIRTRAEAEEVLVKMGDILDEYDEVTVSEFLELVGLADEFTDRGYGWRNLRDAEVRRVRDGYILDLPEPRSLPR